MDPALDGRTRAPDFRPGLGWINTGGRRCSLADFRGRVLLLDFWTYGCVNCMHVLPELREIERIFFADAEASAVRWAVPGGATATIVGTGLFDFGDRDGAGTRRMLACAAPGRDRAPKPATRS